MPVLDVGQAPFTSGCSGPWAPDTLECLAALPADDRTLIVQAASDMLFAASGRQFTGICTDRIRPPSANVTGGSGLVGGERLADGSLWLGYSGVDTLPESTWGLGGFPTSDVIEAGGFVSSTVHLPNYPVVDVVRVTVNGVDLPAGSWRIVDDRWIIPADGASWPLWQRLDRAAGQPDTWSIEYTWGVPIPAAGILAARVLACELGKSIAADGSCRLPKRLQSITREGMTAVVLDPFTFLDKGRFGIYEIDVFVEQTNPAHLSRDAKVLNVDLMRMTPRRVR